MSPAAKPEKGANVVFDWTLGYNNAVLNFMHNPKGEFMLYGDAYHEAGKRLLQAHVETGGRSSLECVPIVFLYRQALELNLKSIIIHGNAILRLNDKPDAGDKKTFHSHNLTALFSAVEIIVEHMNWKEGYQKDRIESFEDCRLVVNHFNEIDPQSDTFRYPINKRGEGSVAHHFGFDIRFFASRLDPVIELMSGTAYALDHEYDGLCEMLNEARQAELEMAAEYQEYDEAEYDEGHYEPEHYQTDHYEPDYEPADY